MDSLASESMAVPANRKLHIAMFPWLAVGHMIPFLELSKLIALKGHKISFLSTPRNISRLPKLPPNLANCIEFVPFPLSHEKLPENAEATVDVPYDKVKYLKLAFDQLEEPLTKFLEAASPDWIFYDFAPYWLPAAAVKLGVSRCFFSISTAASLGFLGPVSVLLGKEEYRNKPEDFTKKPKWVPFETSVRFRMFEILRLFGDISGDDENVSFMYRLALCIEGAEILAIRSCTEFQPEWLKLTEELHQKPVLPVGQLPTTEYDAGDCEKDIAWREIKGWLDKQEKGTVIYVAFGSEATPTQTELTEIALGLEISGLPFFWALRKRQGASDPEVIELPNGFEERTRERGVVCMSWAPQLKILGHDSVGGFLTHSGWSSVVEAIQFGRPLVLLTYLADTGINARILEEKGIGHSIPRDERDGSFSRDSVAESLKLVTREEGGKIYRDKIREVRPLFCDSNRQDKYVENLLGHLLSHQKAC